MNIANSVCCFRRKDHINAYILTRDNAQELLNMMGYSQRVIKAKEAYGDQGYARITDNGIEYGSRFGHYSANFGDYILDYDGKYAWAVYSPEKFNEKFCVWQPV